MKICKQWFIVLALAVFVIPGMPAKALENGDTLRIIVPYSPGGGYDSQARLAAPFVEAALREGGLDNVEVIVENVTGGSGAIATATTYAAPADGKTVLFLDPESSIWQQALANALFEVDKFSYIAQMSIDPMVFMVRANLGLDSFAEVVARSQEKPILIGTSGKGGYDHIMPLVLRKMLTDAGHNIAFEYLHLDGTAPMLASMRRGEVEGALEVISTFGGAEEAGELTFLFDFIEGGESGRWPDATDVTNIADAELALVASAMNYRRVFVAPPNMGKTDLNTLRNAFKAALENPELLAKSIASLRPITFVGGNEIRAAVQQEAALARKFAAVVEAELK